MANWFQENPVQNPGFMQKARWQSHVWARQRFAGSFASGGFASTAFAPTSGDALSSPWRSKPTVGSYQYMENLRQLQKMHPKNRSIQKAINNVKRPVHKGAFSRGMSSLMSVAGPAAVIGGSIYFAEDNTPHEIARSITTGIGADIGWIIGAKAGAGIGAAVGGPLGAVVGGALGAIGGGIAGGQLTDAMTRIPDQMVDSQRRRRSLDWGKQNAAFNTQRAATMRQQSLAAMNRGQLSARSLLGQEAVFVHK